MTEIKQRGSHPTKPGPAEYFTGSVWLEAIVEAPEPARIRAILVAFEPGARTAWHTHPLGQTLYVTHGTGRFQTEGEPVRIIGAGDSSGSRRARSTGTAPAPTRR